ncbi:hypothetical protein TNCV_246711 [Trichonephila clavipes]|nr:hypothetical protein TNCV_246711 [Trichonephila clavipes]
MLATGRRLKFKGDSSCREFSRNRGQLSKSNSPTARTFRERRSTCADQSELAERWTELPQVSDESRSFFRVHTGYFSNIPKCIKAEFIASWACSQSSVVSSSKR